jgi:hypothetical protein
MIINNLNLRPLATFSLVCLSLLTPTLVRASEPLFGYMYTTDLLPKGKFELEQWITDRDGQVSGHFHHFDMSTELEYGVSDHFQVAFYLKYMYANESANSVRGKTEGIEIPYNHNPDEPYSQFRIDGVSLEFMYRVLSPYVDPVGLAFYIEPEFGGYSKGIELRGILQKNFLDDLLVLDANVWVEYECEDGSNLVDPGSTDIPDGVASNATYAEIDLGASYRFATGWTAGLEFRDHNEFGGLSLNRSDQDHMALFLGPNIHYASQNWFFTLSLLRQLTAFAYTAEQQAQTAYGRLYGNEHTNWDGIRLKVGFPFE